MTTSGYLYKFFFAVLIVLPCKLFAGSIDEKRESKVVTYPAPVEEKLSDDFKVLVAGHAAPVYVCKVSSGDRNKRFKVIDNATRSAYYEEASFAYFDMKGRVSVTITVPQTIQKAVVLPLSAGIHAKWVGHTLSFQLTEPRNLNIEINGDIIHSLTLFANPIETDKPKANDPQVVFFGQGVHEINLLNITDNQTLYVSGGAVLRAVIDPKEHFRVNPKDSLKNYDKSTINLVGKHINFRGRGIIDASACPVRAKNLLFVNGSDIKIEGVIFRDASCWTVPVRRSERVDIDNIKLLGYRANSDGIDICNSRQVTVENCFIRTADDLVVIKTDKGQGVSEDIVVKNCVLWNQVAHALSIGAEIREPIRNVLFTDCDVLHDLGREWTLRIYQCDAALVEQVRFENIRIADAQKPISVWIGKAIWSRDPEYGQIQNVTFKNIDVSGTRLRAVELHGGDGAHVVKNVSFEKVLFNGQALTSAQITANSFVDSVQVKPY